MTALRWPGWSGIIYSAAALSALLTLACAWRGWWVPAGVGAIGTGLGVCVARWLARVM